MRKIFALLLALALALPVSAFATSCILATAERTALATQLATDLSGGHLIVYTGSDPGINNAPTGTVLVDWTLPSMSGANVNNGVLTLPTVTNVNASATNTAGYARLFKSNGTTAVLGVDVGVGSFSLSVNTTSVVSGGPCSLSGTITVPAGT